MTDRDHVHDDESRVSPPLTVSAAEEVVRDLEHAMELYRNWLMQFQAMLVCRTKPPRDMLWADAHHNDAFGRWYYGAAVDHVRRHPGFGEIGALHKAMLGKARPLAAAVENDQPIAPSAYWAFRQRHDRFREALTVMTDDARQLLRHTDPMTGIANRFAMLPQVQKERDRVARTGRPSCVCMSDIDRFKRVNDTYGHQAGDLILRTVARFMLDNLRRYDQVCRYGGEEFLLLLPDTTPARAKHVLDRLRRGLAHEEVPLESGERISVTASFGVAALDPSASIMVAIDHADQAMYEAKEAGRNRVRVWAGDAVDA